MRADQITGLWADRCIACGGELFLTTRQATWLSGQWHRENPNHANADPEGFLSDGSIWRMHVMRTGGGCLRITARQQIDDSAAMADEWDAMADDRAAALVAQWRAILDALTAQGQQTGDVYYDLAVRELSRIERM